MFKYHTALEWLIKLMNFNVLIVFKVLKFQKVRAVYLQAWWSNEHCTNLIRTAFKILLYMLYFTFQVQGIKLYANRFAKSGQTLTALSQNNGPCTVGALCYFINGIFTIFMLTIQALDFHWFLSPFRNTHSKNNHIIWNSSHRVKSFSLQMHKEGANRK